ncbi:MAG: FkbM family methyltransferase [Flavobacteriales bacterium]|nr:FkbM family methyltransferase [Flavobacteriales bacterium]MBK7111853.1 FkbM family methyltransferase [Flavobacteriales bacterium]HQW04509.1 FkbM family methyltransferase [Flavobacteriales bacterium]
MTLRSLLRDLTPPIILRLLRPAPTPKRVEVARKHVVQAGPLQGLELLVNDAQPAFREMISGSYDDYIWAAMPSTLAGGVVLDIGGHIGYHTLGLAAKYPSCKVVVFEPNPANVERLEKHVEMNATVADRIEIRPVALSDGNGNAVFNLSSNIDDQTSSGSYLQDGSPPLDAAIYERSGFVRTEVAVHRLDDLAKLEHWAPVQLMKIDVEGAEHLVLAGAEEVLQRDHPILLIEIHSVVCMLKVLELIHPLGYSTELLHEDRASRCFIAARAVR